MKYTLNKFRQELGEMDTKQKQERLKELQMILLQENGKEKSNAFFGAGQKVKMPHQTWLLRKEIAMIKTALNVKGYHYHPRV